MIDSVKFFLPWCCRRSVDPRFWVASIRPGIREETIGSTHSNIHHNVILKTTNKQVVFIHNGILSHGISGKDNTLWASQVFFIVN